MKRKILVPMFASAVALSMNTVSNADNMDNQTQNNEENNQAIALDEYKEEQYKKAVVKDGVAVKIREDGDVKKVAYAGESFKVIATQGQWTKVLVDDETEGWVASRYIETEQTSGYITAEKVNFRTENNKDCEIIEELEIGKDLQVLEVQGEWVKVKSGETEGFVSARYLSEEAPVIEEEVLEEESTEEAEENNENAGVAVASNEQNTTNVASNSNSEKPATNKTENKTENKTNSNEQTSSSKPQKVEETKEEVKEEKVEETKVEEQKQEEKVEQQEEVKEEEKVEEVVVETSSSNAVQSILNLAYSKQGSPYVWGAEGPNSFDCSGFTSYVFKNAVGINLPRTSSAQSGYGKTVSRANLQPGDLVFFNTNGSGVSHVGIYVGNGNMIHSPSSGKSVSVTSINSSYYSPRFVTAKRIL